MKRLVTILLALTLMTGPALACGNPLLYAMLFARYPDAKIVYDSEIENRENGFLQERKFPATPELVYHQWSLANATEIANSLNATVTGNLEDSESLLVLLADEVYGVRFTGGASAPVMVPLQTMERGAVFDAFTTTNALRAISAGEIGWQTAIKRNLVLSDNSSLLVNVPLNQ
ncbi:MAG: hypothetical protein ACR2O0_15725 [Rhizobiaceae bacterium]